MIILILLPFICFAFGLIATIFPVPAKIKLIGENVLSIAAIYFFIIIIIGTILI